MRHAAGVVALLIIFAASAAVAAPFDGPRWQEFDGERYPLYVVPGAVSVTWAPGVVDTWPEEAAPIGADVLQVGELLLDRTETLGGNRYFTARYDARGPLSAEQTRALARALAQRSDIQVASPMWALSPTDHADPWAITDRVLVQLVDHSAIDQLRAWAESVGIERMQDFGNAPHQWELRVPQRAELDPVAMSMELSAMPWTRWAECDWLIPMFERYTPADPLYGDQWHLNNTGQAGGTSDNDMDVAEAWDLELGSEDIIVSAQDNGVDLDHPDLQEDLLPGYDFVNGDPDPSPVGGSHGTSVAGCMAAPENNEGVVGVCPACKILPVRIIGASSQDQAAAHDFSVDNGAAVINNSWGPSDSADPSTPQPIPGVVATSVESAATAGRDGKGVAIFWAGGNGNNNGQTCSQDGYVTHVDTIGVGASNNLGGRSSYSELCPELELSGPSNGGTAAIVTTQRQLQVGSNAYTSNFGGTSAASPNTAGAAALVLSALPDLTLTELRDLLKATAEKIDQTNGNYDLDGHSTAYGYGRVNAFDALQGEVATLTIPTGLQQCDAVLDLSVSIPTTPGLGSVTVDAWSDTETDPEVVTLTETSDGVYEGSVQLTEDAPVAGDGFVSVVDNDRVFVLSAEADATKLISVDCAGPILSAFEVRDITATSAIIYWETNEPADGEATWDGGGADDPIIDLDHLVVALNLTPCTNYSASLTSTDAAGLSSTVENAVAWRAPGDPTILPDDALPDADPCDESTWYEPETPEPGDDDDDSTTDTREPGGFEGQGCTKCQSSVAGGGVSWLALGLVGALARRRRR